MTDELTLIVYCLGRRFPAPVTEALLFLVRDENSIGDAHEVWKAHELGWRQDEVGNFLPYEWTGRFAEVVTALTGNDAYGCSDCTDVVWEDDCSSVAGGDVICDNCIENYTVCCECEKYHHDDEVYEVEDYYYCDYCRDRYCSWCDSCEVYFRHNDHDHDDSCECEAPNKRFLFPANGDGTVRNDQRLEVTLPAGVIDDEGIRQIHHLLYDMVNTDGFRLVTATAARSALEAVGDQWLADRGNFTRRLSRELYANHNVKIPPATLTKIGNVAREHSSDESTWSIEFTRDLNLPPEDFAHGESCWWGSYSDSRCALKSWGGVGMRAFDTHFGCVDGRAWIQPLNSDFEPTHDTIGAHAYVVFNCYGTLSGAKAARIVGHLTGGTYRKVPFDTEPQYINNKTGWLVGPEDVIAPVDDIYIAGDSHHAFDADLYRQEVAA